MSLLKMDRVSRTYENENKTKKVALSETSIIFPNSGLIAISGKSGSGKSTILNLLGLLDKPTEGHIYFDEKDITSLNRNEQCDYRNYEVGIIFQHYQLFTDEDVLFNIMLPMLISGASKKEAEKDATYLLDNISFPKELYQKHKCADLSGGEQERVAILRALINGPRIILADEPTGALDSKNAELVMSILKNASRKKLVILVSHNDELVEKYADRIIYIKDGAIVGNKIRVEENNGRPTVKPPKTIKHKDWVYHLAISNVLKRMKRNIITYLSLTISILASLVIIGFGNGSNESVRKETLKQADYGVATISKEVVTRIPNSGITLTKQFKPNKDEEKTIIEKYDDFYITNNYDALVPASSSIKSEENELDKLFYQPIYSFVDDSFDKSLLVDGFIPTKDSLHQALINTKAYDLIKETGIDPLRAILTISSTYTYNYYPKDDIAHPVITDYFIYEKNVKITGVLKELDFLSSANVYYPVIALETYLEDIPLINLSTYMEEEYTWGSIVSGSNSNDPISSYSLRLFLKDHKKKSEFKSIIEGEETFAINANSIVIGEALSSLVMVSSTGMELFLAIALLGTMLILGIVSFSSYVEDKKKIAILKCLGARQSDIMLIYVIESMVIGLASLISAFLLSPLASIFVNKIVFKLTGLSNVIVIPYSSLFGIPFLLPIMLVFITLFLCLITTCVPILFSKKIEIKEELKDE